MKKAFSLIAILLLLFGLYGCSSPEDKLANEYATNINNKLINVKGSDTMAVLSKTLAEKYMSKYPENKIAVVGGGTSTGIRALIDGTADIANASRKMKPEEMSEAESKGMKPQEYPIALDGVAIVVSPGMPLKSLSIPQLKDIFSGKLTNWKQVGGSDSAITVISRESNSGTYLYIKDTILKDESYVGDAIMVQSSPGVGVEVAKRNNAIGYLGIADAHRNPQIKIVSIAKEANSLAVLPSIQTVKSGEYPLSRPLLIYVSAEPAGQSKQFIEFMLSKDGQRIVEEQGYIPLK